jgi:uncharacterized protein (TIGR03067 family)
MTAVLLVVAVARSGDDDLARDRKRIQGTWIIAKYDQDGVALPPAIRDRMRVTVLPDRLVIKPKITMVRMPPLTEGTRPEVQFRVLADQADEARYVLKRTKKANVIELTQDGPRGEAVKLKGLYLFEGDTLAICIPLLGRKLPKTIPDAPKAGLVLERAPAAKKPSGSGE